MTIRAYTEADHAWGRAMADGHRQELHCLTAGAPGVRLVWPCMLGIYPGVVGVEGATLVAATMTEFVRATGPAQWRIMDDARGSAVVEAPGIIASSVGVPQARRLAAATR